MRKSALIAVLAVVAGCNAAHADTWVNWYHDEWRLHGHKRSEAAFKADLKACAAKAGVRFDNRKQDLAMGAPDPPALRNCMLTRGLRWQRAYIKQTAPSPAQDYTWHWVVRHNDPRDAAATEYATPPTPPVDVPPLVYPPTPPLTPQEYPGYFDHRDDRPSN